MRDVGIYSIKRALPRMSWHPKNLYNLYQRTVNETSEPHKRITFTRSSQTLFQQRWTSKAVVRAYHGDYIPEKIFKRWYLPDTLPDVRPKRKVIGDDSTALSLFSLRKEAKEEADRVRKEEERKGMAPVGSLMFREIERRLDVLVFRACFAHSVYEARRLVVHGDVMINGVKHNKPNTRLAPGDMITVNPDAIRMLNKSKGCITKPTDQPTSSASTNTPVSPVTEAAEAASTTSTPPTTPPALLTHFSLPPYAAPHIFIPAYLEVNFKTCSAIYVRHPTARPGYSEIPTPYNADGDVVRFAWEWYTKVRPRIRSARQLSRMPEDRAVGARGHTARL